MHLDVVKRPLVVFDKDVKPYALTVVTDVDRLLCDGICDPMDTDAENFLNEPLADPLVLHDFEEQKVVADRELVPCFDLSQGNRLLSSILRRAGGNCKEQLNFERMKQMLNWLRRTDNQSEKILEQLKKAKEPVMLFGAGNCGELYLHIFRDNGIKVSCFLDDDVEKQKMGFCGVPVRPLSYLSAGGDKSLYRPTVPIASSSACFPSTKRVPLVS